MIKYLSKSGFEIVGRKGSHVRLKKLVEPRNRVVIVPDHKELAQGTLRSILRQAGITFEEFAKSVEK
ncbi:MAG: type II toxin-antitoxin system HicA family toxin, partial [Candidatus Thorarchaeota archaeon]|nr:type II toxin-antitoxin system HicA family toxin [Candidatus Thorarchaeota archaeon]